MTKRIIRSINRFFRPRHVALILGGTALTLSGCTTVGQMDEEPMVGVLEPIHGAAFTDNLAIVRVTSNGCTTKDDLVPHVRQSRDFSILTVRRVNEDQCREPVADGLEVQWTFEELGLPQGTSVTVNNPFRLRDVVVQGRKG